jgi:predicted Zn-dependent protease
MAEYNLKGQPVIDEEKIATLRILGYMYWRLGLTDKAERLFKALLALNPGNAVICGQLAAIALDQGRPETALEYVEQLLTEAGAAAGRFLWLIKAQALGRLDRLAEARAALDEYMKASEKSTASK